jgi:hypothetical protein
MKKEALTMQTKVGKIPSKRRIAYRGRKGLFTFSAPIGFRGRITVELR